MKITKVTFKETKNGPVFEEEDIRDDINDEIVDYAIRHNIDLESLKKQLTKDKYEELVRELAPLVAIKKQIEKEGK